MRVVKHYCRLPRELVNASFLEMFKGRLVGALNNLMWLMMYLVLKLLYYFMINSSNAWVKTQVGYTEGNMHENIFWFFTVSCEKAPPVHKIRNISCPANYTKLYVHCARTIVLIFICHPGASKQLSASWPEGSGSPRNGHQRESTEVVPLCRCQQRWMMSAHHYVSSCNLFVYVCLLASSQ